MTNDVELQRLGEALQSVRHSGGLAPKLYHSESLYRLELNRIFSSDWVCLGRTELVGTPGNYLCSLVGEEPVVIVRDHDRRVRVLSRVCRHRSMLIVSGSGTARQLTCPYHAWSYGLDGKLIGAPLMDDTPKFKREMCALPELNTETWNGFLFATLNPNSPPITLELGNLTQYVTNYRLDEYDSQIIFDEPIDCNWKVMMENTMESYHHIAVHRNTLHELYPARKVYVGECTSRHVMHHNRLANAGPPNKNLVIKVGALTLTDEQAGSGSICTIFPNVTISLGLGSFLAAITRPIDVGRCQFTLIYGVHDSTKNLITPRGDVREQVELILKFNKEDMDIVTLVDRGLRSPSATPPPLNSREETILYFHRYLARRLLGEGQ